MDYFYVRAGQGITTKEDENRPIHRFGGITGCRCVIQYYFNPTNIISAESVTVPIKSK
jgi:hypothetical protein